MYEFRFPDLVDRPAELRCVRLVHHLIEHFSRDIQIIVSRLELAGIKLPVFFHQFQMNTSILDLDPLLPDQRLMLQLEQIPAEIPL